MKFVHLMSPQHSSQKQHGAIVASHITLPPLSFLLSYAILPRQTLTSYDTGIPISPSSWS
jgi:hypothetical protein